MCWSEEEQKVVVLRVGVGGDVTGEWEILRSGELLHQL